MESVLFLGENESAFLNVLGGNYLGVGRILSLGVILISVFILMRKNNKKTTIFGLFLLTAYLYVMFVSGGRGPLVSLVPLLILLAYVSFNKQGGQLALTKKFIPSALAVFLAVIGIINLLNSDKVPQGLKRFLLLFEGNSMGDSADTRLYFYAQSFDLWKESFFFGNGIGSWPVMMGIGDKRGYPHNIFYEVGSELGVIGLAVLVILMYMSIHMLFTNFKQDIYKAAILMLFLSMFINTMVSGDLSDNRFLFTTLGLMCYQNSFKQTTNVMNNRLIEERGLNN
ncbi:O-antigen ligase family protein [Siminovitchia acidinfaciens]|nr:O-antigen ligase family protein [Siminovitchia acidinfaciens]